MTRTIYTALALVAAGGIGALLFAWSGLYNVAASREHLAITNWFLHFTLRNSVETHAMPITAPPLDDEAMVFRGLGHYEGGCKPCHGAPGDAGNPIVQQILPHPPNLVESVKDWSDAELFWIVKNGLKYAGMPAWVAPDRDDEVWSVIAFLRRMSDMPADEYRRLARNEGEALVDPARDAAGHDLHGPAQFCEAQGGLGRTVAMRAGAIGHEERVLRPVFQLRAHDLAHRQVDRPVDMAAGEERRAADVQQHEVRLLRQGVVNIPAIGLEGELGGEMRAGEIARRGGDGGDGGRGHMMGSW